MPNTIRKTDEFKAKDTASGQVVTIHKLTHFADSSTLLGRSETEVNTSFRLADGGSRGHLNVEDDGVFHAIHTDRRYRRV